MGKAFVTSFPGKRDNYQLVAALQQENLLAEFITDFYNRGMLSKLIKWVLKTKVENRFSGDLNEARISYRPDSFIINILLSKFFRPSMVAVWQDNLFAKIAIKKAQYYKVNLFLYEFQADYAFRKKFDFPCEKILFHFHTHPTWEHEILLKDSEKYPLFKVQTLNNTRQNLPPRYANHTKDAWKFADKIIVASECTKQSLLYAGANARNIFIVPYGFNQSETTLVNEHLIVKPEKPFFLYVGSGTQRKGLHHLCEAWEKSGLGITHNLLVIARTIDPGMDEFLSLDKSIHRIKGVSKEELIWHYQNAVAFVMPSLSEGFGQVYLEALSNGCIVIGTAHSMLADLPAHESVIIVEAGDINALIAIMINQSKKGRPSSNARMDIVNLVTPFTWERFREGIISVIKDNK